MTRSMLTKAQLKSIDVLLPPLGYIGVINLALLLCGARPAFIYDGYNLDRSTQKAADGADEDAYARIVCEHGRQVATAIVSAFKELDFVIHGAEPMIYDPAKANKKDLAILGVNRRKSKVHVRAVGRLLGYVGTAAPRPNDREYVTMTMMCVDTKKRAHILFTQAAYPSEVFEALRRFNEFLSKAMPLIGQRLAKGLVVKEFIMRFHQFPLIQLGQKDEIREGHFYERA